MEALEEAARQKTSALSLLEARNEELKMLREGQLTSSTKVSSFSLNTELHRSLVSVCPEEDERTEGEGA